MLGVFCSLDFILFYVFWEVMLVPMYFLIGVWGGPRRLYAAIKFFLYTLVGSVLMLVGILTLYFYNSSGLAAIGLAWSRSFGDLLDPAPLHHRAADPSGGPVLGIPRLLRRLRHQGADVPVPHLVAGRPRRSSDRRLGDPGRRPPENGDLRFHPLLAAAAARAPPSRRSAGSGVLSIVAIVYGALVAMAQKDMKKLVAYSSVSHMGFVMLGMFALNEAGLRGSILQMLNHGVSTGALFLLVGIVYERRHNRMISEYGAPGQGDAALRDLLHDHHHVVDRSADLERFHR